MPSRKSDNRARCHMGGNHYKNDGPNGTSKRDRRKTSTTYKPEYSWNYEVGSHLTLWEGRLWADVAAFYMDTRDQHSPNLQKVVWTLSRLMQEKVAAMVQKQLFVPV